MASDGDSAGAGGRRGPLFAVIAAALGIVVGFAGLEAALGWLRNGVETSHRLDRGLIRYDAGLGWVAAPGWRGRHRHHDFDVGYTTNPFGFRGTFDGAMDPGTGRRIGILGDSFTFGLGVDDGETLADELGRRAPPGTAVLNLAVPGYSTDQELLLAERLMTTLYRPTELVIVVYLANDVIDNELAWPIQAAQAKPYFRLAERGLTLHNVPVPQTPKPAAERARTLGAILHDGLPPPGIVARTIGGLEVVRRLGIVWPAPPTLFPQSEARFRPSLDLFAALVARLRTVAARHRMRLTLALLPGRSFFARSDSASAQYQDHVRREIVRRAGAMGIEVVDLGAGLRARSGAPAAAGLYFPNDGHLTPAGHRAVAGLLAERLF
jgi:lysophospholipase L1-like esterase